MPQITNVQDAPCHNPDIEKVIKVGKPINKNNRRIELSI